jgi:hypothetical protein
MLGRVDEADQDYDRVLRIGRELNHPPSLACSSTWVLHGAFRFSYSGQMGRLAAIAKR